MGFYFYACMWFCPYSYGALLGGPLGLLELCYEFLHKLSETFHWYQEDLETAQGYRQYTFIRERGINYTAPSFQKEAGTFGGVIILLITSPRNIITSTTESCHSLYSPAAATKKLGVASPITTEKAWLWILVEWNPLINAKSLLGVKGLRGCFMTSLWLKHENKVI